MQGNGIKIDSQIEDNYPLDLRQIKHIFVLVYSYISVLYLRNIENFYVFLYIES